MLNPMYWLLKYQAYPPAVVVAVLLHAFVLYLLLGNALTPDNLVDLEKPVFINATVIQQNPQRLRRLEQLELQRAEQEANDRRARNEERAREQRLAQERADREAAQAAEQAEAERVRQTQARAREQAEAEARQQTQARLDAEREAREREQALAREQAAREEAARVQAAAQQAEALESENQLVQQYSAIIHDLVQRNWIQPPGARNEMVAVLGLRMVPTGELITVDIIQSSGNAAFDRSAVQAVNRVGRFSELQGMPVSIFDKNFRNFNLRFSPEDLLR